MAIGLTKDTTIVGIEEEVTAGTYIAPQAATSFIQPLEDGLSMTPSREDLQRSILTSDIGMPLSRVGMKSMEAALPVEFRGSGVEGGAPDFDLLLQGALGNRRQIASRFTTGAGHSTTVINGTAVDSTFTVGDIIVVLEAGDHSVHAVTAVTSTTMTILPARSVAPSDAVEISKTTVYYPADTGHKSLSVSSYWGNKINMRGIGMKVTSMSLENFSTGQLASWSFGLQGLSFDQVAEVAPFTPTFDSELPPVILNACIYQDGVQIDVNNLSLSLTNTLGFITSTCDVNGKIESRVRRREVSGSFNPYMDDTSTAQFDRFNDNTSFSLFAASYNPSSVSGEIDLGSVVGIYLPNCVFPEFANGEQDGILTDDLSFRAHTGEAGGTEEIFIGVI